MPTSTLRECLASPNFDINEMTKGWVMHFSLDRTNHFRVAFTRTGSYAKLPLVTCATAGILLLYANAAN